MSNKHDANVRKSTLVNFQIGLVASLLFTYLMFEVYTTEPVMYTASSPEFPVEETFTWNEVFTVYKEPVKEVIAEKHTKPVVDPQDFQVVDNGKVIEKVKNEFKNLLPAESEPINPNILPDDPDEDPVEVPFIAVESVPVFPGCEKLATNREKAVCFSEKVGRIVSRKFNTGLGERYGLTGLQRIYAQFNVDADGVITNIQIRAPHPKLQEEAERVINLFPQMTPGKQRGEPVIVKYNLPIMFKIQD